MSFCGLQKQQQQHQQPTQRTQEEERCRRTKSTRSYYSHRRKVFCGFSSRLVLSLHCILFLTFLLDNSSKISTVYAFAIPTSSSSSSSSLSYNKNVNTMLTRNGKATTASTPSTNLNGGGGRERKPTTSTTKLHMIAGPALAVVGGALSDSIIGTMTNPFWKTCGIYVACDVLGFIISYVTGSHVHLDLIGTGAFAVATLPTLLQDSVSTTTQYFSSMAVLLWSTRLASFLFYRATQVGNDKRLETMLSNVPGMIQFWGITLLWNIFCSLPHNLGLLSSSTSTTASAATTAGGLDPTIFLKAGGFVYVVGLIIEVTSDFQKWFFKKSNPGKFCNVGMFKYSQHPHYFGNLVLWAGIFIMNLPGLIDTTTSVSPTPESASTLSIILSKVWSYRKVILSLLSPIFMWSLFSGQANGTATNAMELATTKYGNDPNYKVYLERTPKIIPKFW